MKIIEIENPIFELIFSEAFKEMCLYENDEELIKYIDENINSEDLLNDHIYEVLLPYLEGNVVRFVGVPEDLLIEGEMVNSIKRKLNPRSLLKIAQSGARKAALMAKNLKISKAITAGLVASKQEWKKKSTSGVQNYN